MRTHFGDHGSYQLHYEAYTPYDNTIQYEHDNQMLYITAIGFMRTDN